MKLMNLNAMNLAKVNYLSSYELYLVFLQTILLIFISVPYTIGDIKIYFLLAFMLVSIVQIIFFSIRRGTSNYKTKYCVLMVLYIAQFFLMIIVISFLQMINDHIIFQNMLAIISVIFFCIIGFLSLSMSIKYIFYLRLKKMFPTHGDKENSAEVKLINLAPFLSVDKQIAYLLLHYGINLTIYGYYTFLCLLAFKLADFSKWELFNQIQMFIQRCTFINFSNAIGLFSIFLALLTICIPAQQKIRYEAEQRYFAKFK
ncbi:hypothetical protein DCE79_16720 [Lysinibacillus sp. 2017]|uniref:hypothetical protein n=1 Tax=unclassified Lysinibacillus TaxID=2636778 RepID=UPI000D525889|nr:MULTISPECIES: hypothetical protein [unclassified Lysinibacillus]AWE08887.1 hypothetical protein DCE79_16720 [Lysinibacillus sp. 2017]TGN34729.1 hypothetical protein E4L99_13195 [Lysinibacillus sp. S2017]